MDQQRSNYQSPFSGRYASQEMQQLFSQDFKFRTWRRLWIALAEVEQELGLDITDEQLEELRAHSDDINYETAEAREREIRHDVMSHVFAFASQAPAGGKILHLGATSCFITDNTDLIILRSALHLLLGRLLRVIENLARFAREQRALPCLGFTHYQPAQLTTVGKRATLWLQDLLIDYRDLERLHAELPLRGVKGTTGTQASFMKLFQNDEDKVRRLDQEVCRRLGFENSFPVTGQTYPRKTDSRILSGLSGLGQSCHKFATDIRLLSNLREIEEPFGKSQVGSSAMAYKRNPMRSERICSLSRYLISLAENPAYTAAVQWLERTLDDSANRRIVLAEACLAADSILLLMENVSDGLVVNQGMIRSHVDQELPFMLTENLLMEAVARGGDRQKLHEIIRTHSHTASTHVKQGENNDLLDSLATDNAFPLSANDISTIASAGLVTGRAASQVDEFLDQEINPLLESRSRLLEMGATEHTIL